MIGPVPFVLGGLVTRRRYLADMAQLRARHGDHVARLTQTAVRAATRGAIRCAAAWLHCRADEYRLGRTHVVPCMGDESDLHAACLALARELDFLGNEILKERD